MSEKIFESYTKFDNTSLKEIFKERVYNPRIAWYVDYYLKNPEQYALNFLAENSDGTETIRATSEDKDVRDPNDEENRWNGEEVTNWFYEKIDKEEKIEHIWILLFKASSGEVFGQHVEANKVFCFGPESLDIPGYNQWDIYVEDGLFGPLNKINQKSPELICIIDQPDLFGRLAEENLLHTYLMQLLLI